MKPSVDVLYRSGFLCDLSYQFALAMGRIAGECDPQVLLGAAAASSFTSVGHTCVELKRIGGQPILFPEGDPVEGLLWPAAGPWRRALEGSGLVSSGGDAAPLVLDGEGRLYLRRYWDYEQRLATELRRRMLLEEDVRELDRLEEGLETLFPSEGQDDVEEDLQRRAARTALLRRVAVISGGPGTGKTSTVVKILALLIEQARGEESKELRILMAAPTGKAAARLVESIRAAKTRRGKGALACSPAVKAAIPEEASTLHRLLGMHPDSPTRPRHHAGNPLPADVVVIDEASMINLSVMAKLVDALLAPCRLILLGDKDQLASVEAGAVFGNLCSAAGDREVGGSIVHLTHSFRFGPESGIGRLARAINGVRWEEALGILRDEASDDVTWVEPGKDASVEKLVRSAAIPRYRSYLDEPDIEGKLDRFAAFRILCAHRKGRCGVETVNPLVESLLRSEGCDLAETQWYDGRPLLVTHNDYQLELFNGDIGLICLEEPGGERLRAFFPGRSGMVRSFVPSRLPTHETVFAMTVHKSQGSEYDHVLVILPEVRSPVLTRELLYTAVSRARKSVVLYASQDVLSETIQTPIERSSGFSESLINNQTRE